MRLIVTGGGTGGHLFPAIAVAVEVQRRFAGSDIFFIGTGRRIDDRVLQRLGFIRETVNCSGVKGMGLVGTLQSIFRLPLAVIKAARIIRRCKPDLVFAVGGYVTGPVLVAAKIFGVPICIHEQNSVPGLANRLAGKIADRVCISLPCEPGFAGHKTDLTGNPVRKEIVAAAETRSGKQNENLTLLVLGGSQGAHRLNELMLEAAGFLQEQGVQFNIIHQTGKKDQDLVQKGYERIGCKADVADFFTDMVTLYNRADLVISRAGATTLAELAVMGLPALLIPYPYAADDHQTKNGEFYVRGGGARLYIESTLSGAQLAGEISVLFHDRRQLQAMAEGMKSLGKPDATERIVDICLELAGKEKYNI